MGIIPNPNNQRDIFKLITRKSKKMNDIGKII